ncbi:MAG: fumarylacetoacetate hydrolase family protein [Acidimicrobiales bacterium]
MSESEYGLAALLREAYTASALLPLRDRMPEVSVAAAYRIQDLNTAWWVAQGREPVGRKIGLTSPAVQQQLGVDQPDMGVLFADTQVADGAAVDLNGYLQPKIEAEIALVLAHDLENPAPTVAEIEKAVDYVVPAIEIVDSRIADWDIKIYDTVADNGSSAGFVLGSTPRALGELDLLLCGMKITCGEEIISSGVGAACLGHPLNAAAWLAQYQASTGVPLRAGEIVLTGALGPMVVAVAGETYDIDINGVGEVSVSFQ